MLERDFQDKDFWKKDAYNSIKSDLLSVRDNGFVRYGNIPERHLVCVYGKSQVGKTTFILKMIGIKDECCEAVSKVLRGGTKHGNSSTSTAILYSKSESNSYGIKVETWDGKEDSSLKEYSSEEMVSQLQIIRDNVEANAFSNKVILHVFIPKDCCTVSRSNCHISILDLPGVESRNVREWAHVESLLARYLPSASVCIIVCRADNIQSLEKLELPTGIDWKAFPHKFIIVLTYSFSRGTIKEGFFAKSRQERTKGLFDFIQETFKSQLSSILGLKNEIEFFPVEVGQSFCKMLDELKSEDDRIEFKKVRDGILSSLQNSIMKHEGEHLLSAIKNLYAIIESADKHVIESLEESLMEKKEYKKKKEKKREQLENCKVKYQAMLADAERDISELQKTIQEIKQLPVAASFFDQMKKDVYDKRLTKRKRGVIYFDDKNKNLLKSLSNILEDEVREAVEKAKMRMEQCQLVLNLRESAFDIYNHILESDEYKKLYPPSSTIDKLFGNVKVRLDDAFLYIKEIEKLIKKQVNQSVISPCVGEIDKKLKERNERREFVRGTIAKDERRIKSIDEEIVKIDKKIDEISAAEKDRIRQKEEDRKTLDTYMKYAETAYNNQRNRIINIVNESGTSKEEKLMYILLLGVLDQDFKDVIIASNGKD